uniref:Uncharacterized protein n=1 Tax=Trypanosoma congolense (strain IL3000) TaxID=1068625 RepID=G0USB0_TRYCI|nr:hypothetical protein, unlikely [Trypanosoma congolense IL3000]
MMDVTQVFVDDRVVEMQAIGGMCQMAMMQMFTCSGATKLAQASDVIFCVGCTPEDIHKQHPTPSAGGKVKSANSSKSGGKSSGEKEDAKMKPLYVQVDGEAVMSLTVPSVIRVRELCRPRVYVHCANQKVLKQAVAANK